MIAVMEPRRATLRVQRRFPCPSSSKNSRAKPSPSPRRSGFNSPRSCWLSCRKLTQGWKQPWDEEIKRRIAEIDNGTAKLIPAEEVFAELRRLIK